MPINLLMTAAFLKFLSSFSDKAAIISSFCNLEKCTCFADSHTLKEKDSVSVAIAVETKCYSSSNHFKMKIRKIFYCRNHWTGDLHESSHLPNLQPHQPMVPVINKTNKRDIFSSSHRFNEKKISG